MNDLIKGVNLIINKFANKLVIFLILILISVTISNGENGIEAVPALHISDFKVQIWSIIPAGSSVSLNIDKETIAVTSIAMHNVKAELRNAEIEVWALKNNPVFETAVVKVYRYLLINNKNIVDSDIGSLKISFRIPTSWLTDNNIASADISLYRYKDDKWNELATKVTGTDATYVNYEAETPGFSYFAIGSKSITESEANQCSYPSKVDCDTREEANIISNEWTQGKCSEEEATKCAQNWVKNQPKCAVEWKCDGNYKYLQKSDCSTSNKEYCQDGCENGACKSYVELYRWECKNDVAYWYDSRNRLQLTPENCFKQNKICVEGKCVENPNCIKHYRKGCMSDGDVYWFNSCGQKEEKYKDCGTAGCKGEECLTKCLSHHSKGCCNNNREVCWYDSCGNRQEIITTCTKFEDCKYGNCVQTRPFCDDECSASRCENRIYISCEVNSNRCKSEVRKGEVIGKCGVECNYNNDCGRDGVCESSKCISGGLTKGCKDECSFSSHSCSLDQTYVTSCYDSDGDTCKDIVKIKNCRNYFPDCNTICWLGDCHCEECKEDCGDGICTRGCGEDELTCPQDCEKEKPNSNDCKYIDSNGKHITYNGIEMDFSDSFRDYCNSNCVCSASEGDCDDDLDCEKGLYCKLKEGAKYNMDWTWDVCQPKPQLNQAKTKYPVVFVHGHAPTASDIYNSWNKFVIQGDFTQFRNFAKKLQDDGIVLDKGTSLPQVPISTICERNKWGSQFSIRTTYYLENDFTTGFSHKDPISHYAERLNLFIEDIKRCSGAEKVDIVAHSMGGLIAREYIRTGGATSVNKLIMLGTPNKGANTFLLWFCKRPPSIENILTLNFRKQFDEECDEMEAGSSFLNRLNSYQKPDSLKYFAIVGTKDDVVSTSSASYGADGVVYVNCDHESLARPCSEAYNAVKGILLGDYKMSTPTGNVVTDTTKTSIPQPTTTKTKYCCKKFLFWCAKYCYK